MFINLLIWVQKIPLETLAKRTKNLLTQKINPKRNSKDLSMQKSALNESSYVFTFLIKKNVTINSRKKISKLIIFSPTIQLMPIKQLSLMIWKICKVHQKNENKN